MNEAVMQTKKLWIFDMDGLLIESGRLTYQAYLKSAQKYQYDMTKDVFYWLTGRVESDLRAKMQALYGETTPIHEWRDAIHDFRAEIIAENNRVYTRPGAKEILEFGKTHGLTLVLASSNERDKVIDYLELEGLTHYFDAIISGSDVKNGKPHPEIFLKACEQMGITPEAAIVFEDSIAGVKAAQNAGITVVLVPDRLLGLTDYAGKYHVQQDLQALVAQAQPADLEFESLLVAKNYFSDLLDS